MRYEAMGKARRQMLNIPQLLGGVNTATEAEFIDDDELAEACNLCIDHGTLRTREAVRAVGEEAFECQSGTYTHIDGLFTKPIEVDGKMCAVSVLGKNDNLSTKYGLLKFMRLDGFTWPIGAPFRVYSMSLSNTSNKVYPNCAIAPYAEDENHYPFLMYHAGNIYVPDQDTDTIKQVDESKLYAPLIMINGRSVPLNNAIAKEYSEKANGVMYEGYNLLTRRCRASFTPTAGTESEGGEIYQLPDKILPTRGLTMEIVSVKGESTVAVKHNETTTFTLDSTQYTARLFTESSVLVTPSLPVTDVANTVTITYYTSKSKASFSHSLSLATWFGGTANKRGGTRLFLADTENAKLLWSDVNNPFYFPENNYMIVGDASQKITALEKQGDMLVVFKEREIFYTTYVQGEIDTEAVANGVNVDVTASQAYFPLTQLSPQIGCRCPKSIALCRDRLVWMDEDARIYTLVVAGQYSERNVREIGQKIRWWLLKNTSEEQRGNASAIDHNGKYRLMVGNVMAEFDYNDSGFVNVSGYSSGERAARNIAWMTHRFHFDENAVQTLVGDGADKALIISTGTNGNITARTLHRFDENADKDSYLIMNNSGSGALYQKENKDIAISLTTKTYEFGDPAAFKRIHAFYPMLQTDDTELSFVVDGEEPPYGKRYQSADTFAHLVMPGVSRCRTFAVKLKAIGKLCLKGLRMQYSMFGSVK